MNVIVRRLSFEVMIKKEFKNKAVMDILLLKRGTVAMIDEMLVRTTVKYFLL